MKKRNYGKALGTLVLAALLGGVLAGSVSAESRKDAADIVEDN